MPRNTKQPTPYQLQVLQAAAAHPEGRLPDGTNPNSLDHLYAARWIVEVTAAGDGANLARMAGYSGFTHWRITRAGRAALLAPEQHDAVFSADLMTGKLALTPSPTVVESLLGSALVEFRATTGAVRPTDGSVKGEAALNHVFLTPAGLRVVGRYRLAHELEQQRAADPIAGDLLIAALAEWDIPAEYLIDVDGYSHVVHRSPGLWIYFHVVDLPGMPWPMSSAVHRASEHTGWYAGINEGGDIQEMWGVDGDGCAVDSARTAEALAEWITNPSAKQPAGPPLRRPGLAALAPERGL
ncbi:hypothetical protein G3I60_04920 [Streptomyces sp. SID13666]|uniref:hypothetical protein n=1 Tax=Streptomyces sp. SID13666 TaxID=2706054 RepID=UPI0013BF0F00|nr:hypothetical protein [Streptomyces sp. SID13666]NEA53511.1 hypothetical protein [Streptomyces sp. SID13666]